MVFKKEDGVKKRGAYKRCSVDFVVSFRFIFYRFCSLVKDMFVYLIDWVFVRMLLV